MAEQTPNIILPTDVPGYHNGDLAAAQSRLEKSQQYRNLSTIILVPTRGGNSLSARWVNGMQSLVRPMNNQVVGPIFIEGMEVGAAYNYAIEHIILANPVLKDFNYLLCWEDDVIPQPDALLKLYENINDYDVVGALYWTKGEGGLPMIYGDRKNPVVNYHPQVPTGGLQECYGTGMGFTLFKIAQFKKIPGPWFETTAKWDPATGTQLWTQDLNYYQKLTNVGGKIAVDCQAKAGHYDHTTGIVW